MPRYVLCAMDADSLRSFAVTYDYRCPFARNAHEHLVEGLHSGAGWEVDFVPFSLTQSHVEEGGTPVWEDPGRAADLMAIEASIVVRDLVPQRFEDVHLAMFAARHDKGRDLRLESVVRDVLRSQGVDDEEVFEAIADGWPKESFKKAHEGAVAEHAVFGVPTFIAGDDAVFVRVMTRPDGDRLASRSIIEHVLGMLVDRPELNEIKHTRIPN
jgi:DSBA-like thioredoxin domain